MPSTYKSDDEIYQSQRARRSSAGSLRPPRISRSGSSGSTQPPQAVFKVAGWAHAPSSVKRMLDYIGRTEVKVGQELVALEAEDGVERKGQAEVDEIYDEWKDDFKRKSKQTKALPRHAVHLVLSAKAELKPENVEKTLSASRRVLEKQFGEVGYQYALGVHQDGKYPHVHAVVKTVSLEKGVPKLRLGKMQIFEARKNLAEELSKEGLDHVATRRPSRKKARHSNLTAAKPNTLAKVKKVLENMTHEQRQFERALSRKEPSVNAIKHRKQQSKTLDTLRTQAKEDDKLVGQARLDAFNLIRSFRRGIEKKGVDAKVEAKATVNYFEKRIAKWMKEVERSASSEHQKKALPQPLEKAGKGIRQEIDQFLRQDLKDLAIPVNAQKAIYKQLRPQSLAMAKVQERIIGRGR